MKIDREQLLASALGQLSPSEEAEVQRELRADPALQAAFQAELDTLALLLDDLDLDSVQVPVDAEDRLLTRVHTEALAPATASPADLAARPLPAFPDVAGAPNGSAPPLPDDPASPAAAPSRAPDSVTLPAPRPIPPVWWLAAPLGLAAALTLLFVFRPPADPLRQYAQAPGAVSQLVTAGSQTLGTLVRLTDGRVFVHLDRPIESGRTYQLWQIQAGQPVSLGVFGEQGLLTAALPAGATLAVSVEPPGGSPQPTTTPLFAQAI